MKSFIGMLFIVAMTVAVSPVPAALTAFRYDALGRLVLVGVAGGKLTLSPAIMIFRAQSVLRSNTGTVADLRAVVELAQAGKLAPTPVQELPKEAANEAFLKLEHGEITGRAVLVC